MWVPIIENNRQETEAGKLFIREDVTSLMNKDSEIDTIVLACTHYPVIENYIRTLVPSHVKVLTQGALVAERLEDYLLRHKEIALKCSKGGSVHFLTSENKEVFDENAKRFLSIQVRSEHVHL
jgi:glutamate racemase